MSKKNQNQNTAEVKTEDLNNSTATTVITTDQNVSDHQVVVNNNTEVKGNGLKGSDMVQFDVYVSEPEQHGESVETDRTKRVPIDEEMADVLEACKDVHNKIHGHKHEPDLKPKSEVKTLSTIDLLRTKHSAELDKIRKIKEEQGFGARVCHLMSESLLNDIVANHDQISAKAKEIYDSLGIEDDESDDEDHEELAS